jgi:inhibitor of KinA sporulation pathway (predicted exonuclease)
MKATNKIIILDLEATCWKDTAPEGQVSEIIEIGVCILDVPSGLISQSKGILIKPKLSAVSLFCTQLTTITQDMLDNKGISLNEACTFLQEEYNADQYTWASYGAYDLKMMQSQCRIHNIKFPLSQNHINVKTLFAEKKGLKRNTGMSGALQILSISLEGTHHRGIDDAKNIAKILNWCLNN